MHTLRVTAASAAPELSGFAYAFYFLFYEGYAVILPDTVKAVAIAASVVFVVMLLLLADILAA